MNRTLIAAALLALAAAPHAQESLPQPAPSPPAIVEPQDVDYPGTLTLAVDATDLERHVFRVRETIPLAPAPDGGRRVTLLYPQWLPGNHGPTGRIDSLAGLTVSARGQRLEWTRDVVNVYAFHVDVPAGVDALDLDFQFVSPTDPAQGRVVMTPAMLNLQWNAVALYPAGYYARRIPVAASVRLPDGWDYGTALDTATRDGATATFRTVSFETLVDSPMFAGRWFRQIDLDPGAKRPIRLNLVADRADLLDASAAQIGAHRRLVQQADRLFASRHYDHYDFLVALSDELGGIGLEHHRSSENRVAPKYFLDWDKSSAGRDLLAHEYTHSWNGKFRRPADLWTPNFNVPMRDSLLWVYEGQTQYWGYVLAARAGLLSREQTLDALALTAAVYEQRAGRQWRALQDTTHDPIIAQRRPVPWRSWQRSEDYYSEGQLVWLDVDTLIREKSGGGKSLDDFAKAFFGVDDGRMAPLAYGFDDVVAALNAVQPYDWAAFLRQRLDAHAAGAPLDGLKRGGYELIYTDQPSEYFRHAEKLRKSVDLSFSLGLVAVAKDGKISEVIWDGPAFKAGLTVGAQIVAVNGDAYEADGLKDAVAATAKAGAAPLELLVRDGDHYRTATLDYRGGPRYPGLQRLKGTPARLDAILAPRS
ncbi:M61 family metallopeptidase [Solimonas soli]|uniref:M61 family metallopeptidase n=1 Tax=Solimonas soli TaxID=413479 RepID=UPI000489FE51|nr:M61 family metallopeptidase [Solimonas soli]